MKKLFYSFIVVSFCISSIHAKTITSGVAQTVAANFIKQKAGVQVKTQLLAYTATAVSGEAVYFAFNTNEADGFVIVVADDAQSPVIGYSTEGKFVVPPPSSNAGYWMEQRKKEIIANRAQQVQPTAEIFALWAAYKNNKQVAAHTTSSVSPLVKTLWDQPSPYNAQCPGNSLTGCVATTMAQIMRYWSYPIKGTGSSSYNSSYGNLSASYGTTTYNWSNMPLGRVTSSNSDVATLMYQCGVSVNMNYSPSASGAYVTTYDNPGVCAQLSYSKYFGYDAGTIKGLQRFNYSDQNWINLIEADLNASRPVQYVGYDPSNGGHTWVCDGYDSNNNMHMNWGWSGYNDGYYSINSLNPGSSYNFSNGHEVLVGIEPKASSPNDAGILSVSSPNGTTCNLSITPVVRLQNFGSSTLTSCKINYYYDTNPVNTYNWTGSVAIGQYINVTLPALSVTGGTHSFTSYTTNPNNVTDGNVANDKTTSSFTIASSPPALPVTAGFEGSTFLPSGWSIWNPDGDASWQIVTTVAHTGKNCIGMNNCDGNGSTDMTGTKDRFITMPYNFNGNTSASLSFDVAYAPCTYSGKLYSDTLAVYYSFDCGSTWTRIYIKGGITLATASTYNAGTNPGCWSPTTSQWRTEAINVSSLVGHSSVMFAFESRSGYGEWIYVDNINLAGTTVTGISSPVSESFLVYPNPVHTQLTISGLQSVVKPTIELYDVLGNKVYNHSGVDNSESEIQIAVNSFSKGVYFLKVSDIEHSWATKVIVQ